MRPLPSFPRNRLATAVPAASAAAATARTVSLPWDLLDLLRRSFDPLLRVFIYLLIILPSGTLFHINVKAIWFGLLFVPACLHLVETRRFTLRHIALLLLLPGVFAVWIVVAQVYGFPLTFSLSEYKDIVTTLVSCWLAAVYFARDEAARIRFLRTVLHAEVLACVLKVALLLYAVLRGIPVSTLVDAINTLFGVNLMGVDFASSLGRLQFIADGLIPLCVYLLLRYRRRLGLGTLPALGMFGLLVFSLVLTFSRFLWAFGVLAFVLGMLFGQRDRFRSWLLVALGVGLALSFPILAVVVQLRFSASVAGGSDAVRDEQIPALERFFLQAPLFGHGLGSYTSEVIRGDLRYVYEVQLYALAGQVGLAGLLVFGLLTGFYFRELWPFDRTGRPDRLSQKLCLVLLLLVWIASGLLNPSLLNSAAAVSYAMLKALAGVREPGAARRLA